MFKKTTTTAPALPTFTRMDKLPLKPGPVLEAIENFASGVEGEPMYGMTGGRFDGGAVLLRTGPFAPFRLFIPVGRSWLEALTIQPGDPAIAELEKSGALTSYGYSPTQQAKQQRREAEERENLEACLGYQRWRGEIKKTERVAAEAREAKRRAALFN